MILQEFKETVEKRYPEYDCQIEIQNKHNILCVYLVRDNLRIPVEKITEKELIKKVKKFGTVSEAAENMNDIWETKLTKFMTLEKKELLSVI